MFRLLFANFYWKLLSVGIAFGLWYFMIGEPELVTSQSVPVFYKNLPPDLEIGSDVPDRVHLELRGPASKLSAAGLAETAVVLDLSNVNAAGERTFTIDPASMSLPRGVTFLRSVPSQLRLRFERIASKSVEVQIRTSSSPPPGYRVKSEQPLPERLRITGPESRVQDVAAAQTDPIDLSGVYSQATFHVQAYVTDPQVRFEASPAVTVRVTVEKIPPGQ
jgi:YbbR-like protein